MVYKDFIIDRKTFRRRKLTTFQHKLRVLMKCYTIVDFEVDEDAKTFSFKKTHKINGLKMDDPKEYSGSFDTQDIDDKYISLRITVG